MRFFQPLALWSIMILFVALPASAQTILRDAEAERALHELARPVIVQSGLSPSRIRILIIKDESLNAFVLNSQTIFIHSGLLLRMKRPEQLQAVIAHELAHIANGHLTRRPINFRNARNAALVGLALSAAVATRSPEGALGLAAGSQSTAQRVLLGHNRAEESSADQAGVRYLARAGIDPTAMIEVMELFSGQEALSASRVDPYVLTHPLSRERIRGLRGFAAAYTKATPTSKESIYWFGRVQGKLSAFLRSPKWTLRKVKASDTSDSALVRKALAHHKNSNAKKALGAVNQLLAKRPNDAYAHELKGQILLESRQFGPAVQSYARASALAPNQPLILAGYGRALLATKSSANTQKALGVLSKARDRDNLNPALLRDLAQAYAQTGQPGLASVTTAERYATLGQLKTAGTHAKRASGLLPRGSAPWRRAQDILAAAEQSENRRRK
ncbi:M48 family metalloprotease [Alphaproteobacteria bacterium KMM 3653]|uniref:M48 family metalloprotease n=1 Tax=Harenicola maris TaxID=2841044 RepID=A0AAP2CL82_9RHOB|nr:M48 family metalloprotease [Harenicola maris]